MKKRLRRLSAFFLTGLMMLSALFVNPVSVKADDEAGYTMFLAFGGESEAGAGTWDMCWANDTGYAGELVPTVATVTEGTTATIGITFPTAVYHTYYMAPAILASGVEELEYTIESVKLDGVDVLGDIDLTVGDKEWWYEATGEFSDTEAIRLKGGYNDWAAQAFAESPAGFTTIEYTITINKLVVGDGTAAKGEAVASTESYEAFIALGADGAEAGSWGLSYFGDGCADNKGDITAVNGTLTNGETTTLSLTLPEAATATWFVAPCIIVPDSSVISSDSTFDVKVFLDGVEVETDLTAGKSCWAEGTGAYGAETCVRIGGGYNEWGDKYMAESPIGYTTITFEITPNILIAAATEEETTTEAAPSAEFDANGTYNAYIGIQSANYSFRNAFNEPTYGMGTEYFNQITGWDASNNAVVREGTITDAEIAGNGTYTVSIKGLDFADGSETLNLLFLSTDIPLESGVTISDVNIRIGGKSVYDFEEAFLDPDDDEFLKPLFINIWNKELTAENEFAYTLSAGMDVEITFTVSGFAYDNPNAVAEETTTVAPETTKAPENSTTQAATQASTSADEGGVSVGLIIAIVAAVVVVAAIVVVVVKKKK